MRTVVVLAGNPDDRPPGFPCFGCGEQVTEERCVRVAWPNGAATSEVICASCWPRYSPSGIEPS